MQTSQLTKKTLDVLEAAAALGISSMPEIQARCGLSMTTTHRIMQALVERGFLMRTGKGNYRLGSVAIALTHGVLQQDLLAPAARPYLHKLAKQTRSHVHLGVWQDNMVSYLVKRRYGRTKVHSSEGSQLEGYCSALGKILLSGLPQSDFENYVAEGSFTPLTANTIVDPDHLRREITEVRARGWATDNEEIMPGLRCIAVPLTDRVDQIIAALSVSTVMSGSGTVDPEKCLPPLLETAAAIRRHLFPVRSNEDRSQRN